jgi:glucose-1-phosphate thymidylyltransferase
VRKDSLSGPAVIAYADTLIRADFELDPQADAVIGKTSRPTRSFCVVKLNATNDIIELVENQPLL